MKKNIYKLILAVTVSLFSESANAQTWVNVSTDFIGDGADSTLLDGTALDYYYDQASDSLWFRVTVDSVSSANEAAFGVNLMVYIMNGGPTFNFWGVHNTQPYHRLLTAWVTGGPPSNYSGTIGISDSAGVVGSNYTNLSANNISINMDASTRTIVLGLLRNDFVPDTFFGTNSTLVVGLQAAVGSNLVWNDDIYFGAAVMTITKSTTGIKPVANHPVDMNVYHNSANAELVVDFSSPYRKEVNLFITDALGKVVKEMHHINSPLTTVNTSTFSKGIYIVNAVTENNSVITRKVLVE